MKKAIKWILIVLLGLVVLGAIFGGGDKDEKTPVEKQETKVVEEQKQEIKSVVNDIYMDKIIIAEPDNDFTPSELEDYLKNKGYSEENIKTALNYGKNIYYVAYHYHKYINDKSIDEIKKNLLDEKWLKENNVSQSAFTEEEIDDGEKLYEHYKEIGMY